MFKGLISGNEGGDEELAGRLKDWVGSKLADVSVKDEHKVIYRKTFNIKRESQNVLSLLKKFLPL